MEFFPTYQVNKQLALSQEGLGSKDKYWFEKDGTEHLFKAEDRGTGEDWAEVIVCHIAKLLGIPHVRYELAEEIGGIQPRPGVICARMTERAIPLVLGNELLLSQDESYPFANRKKISQHTVEALMTVLSDMQPPTASWHVEWPLGITTAQDVFIGYLMLDALVGNQDRHHENWGALIYEAEKCLAPTFDHAAGLARNLSDQQRISRLTTKDRQ